MSHLIDHTGKRFGRLTALRRDFDNSKVGTYWICQCDCGTVKSVPGSNLVKGLANSCGCLQRERAAKAATTHGFAPSKKKPSEYTTWRSMRNRCERPACVAYRDYGGRGIKVCERWKLFVNFLEDMGLKPTPKHTLDRIDNDGDYSPENCRWVTREANGRNKRNNWQVTFIGETKPLAEWCDQFNLPYNRTYGRLRRGRTPEEAFT
jgi:hypothetical protein